MTRYPLHRFSALADLTADEEAFLHGLGEAEQRRQPGETFQGEGEPARGFHLLIDGWVASSLMLRNGNRFVQKMHLPGDMLGTPGMALAECEVSLTAITEAVTSFVSFEKIERLFTSKPRLAALFTVAVQMERLALMDMLAATGNVTARGYLVRLLLDLFDRLSAIGKVENGSFDLPLTQELIGDLLGITSMHVNRTLRGLESDGLIRRDGRRMALLDIGALRRISPLPTRTVNFAPDWLPGDG